MKMTRRVPPREGRRERERERREKNDDDDRRTSDPLFVMVVSSN